MDKEVEDVLSGESDSDKDSEEEEDEVEELTEVTCVCTLCATPVPTIYLCLELEHGLGFNEGWLSGLSTVST